VVLIRLFLAGDVMTGRGIDQILPHPGDAELRENGGVVSSLRYVELAERANGAIPRPADFAYVWGDAIQTLQRVRPDFRLVNLETSITSSLHPAEKGINYKMNPANAPCLSAAGIDCCNLANNHVLDWGVCGLSDTFEALRGAGIAFAGAGRNAAEAQAPAVKDIPGKGRVLVFGLGCENSGIPADWSAGPNRPGIALASDLSARAAERIAQQVAATKRPGDIVVVSIHWGSNWGYHVPVLEKTFARALIASGVDVVHGHSSHHAKAIEVFDGKLILYGCGDFLNDYEGIPGYEEFRDDLALMYLPSIEASTGRLSELGIVPFQIRNFRLNRAAPADAEWIAATLNREGAEFGTQVASLPDGTLRLRWSQPRTAPPSA
jgi:poly-gamma-glutamate synthesis protein (capsule biosynthesis protein)